VALAAVLLAERVLLGHRELFPFVVAGEALHVGGGRKVGRRSGQVPLAPRQGEDEEKSDDNDHHDEEMDVPGLHRSLLDPELSKKGARNDCRAAQGKITPVFSIDYFRILF
jgi:hypothetical protein